MSILFVCVHNAGRSQMAAGFARALGGRSVEVFSAGSEPANALNPVAVAAMAELGIDIARNQPAILTPDAVRAADAVITMGCGDVCPVFPGKRYEDWELTDPAGLELVEVRPIRNAILRRVEALFATLGVQPAFVTDTGSVRVIEPDSPLVEPAETRRSSPAHTPDSRPQS